MSSTKEGGTAATAEQLDSMSLSESVERKENDTATTENGTPTKMCSACGETNDTLKTCTACKCVWYCDRACQKKHRDEHKHECKRIKKVLHKRGGKLDLGTELDIGPIGKLPPQEECPICMRALPIHSMLHSYFACCGKVICCGCSHQHRKTSATLVPTCAFCRTRMPESEQDFLVPLRKRVEGKDPCALINLAMAYGLGELGLSVDQAKCIDLLRESASLGLPFAQYRLGVFHYEGEMGLEQNGEEGIKYFEEAAEGGHLLARYNIGCIEEAGFNFVVAMRHWRLSASGGLKFSMNSLIECFQGGLLYCGDLAETLQAMYRARAEMKSENRDQFIEHLKKNGEYQAEYEC